MVDNTTLSTGVGGDTIATDDIGGVKFQRIKLIHGVDGTNAGDVAATNPLPVTLSDTTATGTLGALNAFVTLITGGVGTGIFEITGTWVGTITFLGSNNGFTTSQAITAIYLGGIQTNAATTTTNGYFSVLTAGFAQVRAVMTAYTSGSATVLANGSQDSRVVVPLQGNPNNHQVLATLNAGAALVGKVGLDQTTPGTTNAVAVSTVGTTAINAFPAGFQRVTDEPRQIFYDPFDAAIDTTNRWAAPTSAGGGVAASTTTGVMTLGSGTTANGYSYLTSQASFVPTVPAWLGNSWAISIESAVGNNAVRFWGHGIVGGTPSSTTPLGATGNGYGFELDIAGVLQAVVYAGGTRTVVASLAALQPADALSHRYICYYRTDKIYWYIDGLGASQLAATSNFQMPQVQTLPLLALSVAHSAAPAASRVITCTGLAVWDTGKNSTTLSDGTYPWRKLTVSATGALSAVQSGTWNIGTVTTLPALVAGAALIGKVGIDQTTAGTTNAVSIAQIGANTVATGNGVTGTGSQRVTIASDNTAFGVIATGNVASGAADSGNPVKVGGKYTLGRIASLSDGQRADLQMDAIGNTFVSFADAAGNTVAITGNPNGGADGFSGAKGQFWVTAFGSLYNGSTFDRTRGMGIASTTGDTGAKTATGNGATQTNVGNNGIQIVVQLGTVSGTTPTCTFKVQDSADGGTTWVDVPGAATASLTATGNFGIKIYPGIAVTAGTTTTNTTAGSNQVLGRNWRVVWTIGGTTPSFTITAIQYTYLMN